MKIFAIFAAVMILFSVGLIIQPAEGKEAFAQDVGGFIYNSWDGNARLINKEGDWNGNVTVIEMNDIDTQDKMADDAWNDGTWGAEYWDEEVRAGYTWMAYNENSGYEKYPNQWYSNPEEEGENVIFLAEYQHFDEKYGLINYTAISNLPATYKTPEELGEHNIKYEPIPIPEARDIGSNYINITIPYFKYTDFNEKLGEPSGRGSFDCFQSYAVFIRDSKGEQFKEWTYIGNSKPDPKWNEDAKLPIPANDLDKDPTDYNTGRDYFLATGLKEGFEYQFMVRVNFQSTKGDDMGPVWGYGGGLGNPKPKASSEENILGTGDIGGSGTTFGSSGGGDWTPTDPGDNPPSVTIDSPTKGADIASTSVTVEWTGSDDHGIDHYEIKLDTGSWVDVGTSVSHIYSGLSEGSHIVYVKAYDTIGQTYTDSVSFTVDTIIPSISITSPGEGENIGSSSVTVYWSGSDSGSGIAYYYIKLNSGSWSSKGTSTSHSYSSLSEGNNTVDVRAYDNAGNYNTDSVTFKVDVTNPTVTITSPSDGGYTGDTTVTVTWSGSDTNGIDNYKTRIDSGTWIDKATSTSHEYSGLTEGAHTVEVIAYDPAGNFGTDSITFTVDLTDPVVTITTPSNNQIFTENEVTIEWAGNDSSSGVNSYFIRIDYGSWTSKGMSTSHVYSSLTEGSHTVDVWIYDNVYNYDMNTVNFQIAYSNEIVLSSTGDADGWNFLSTGLIPINSSLTSILDDPVYGIPGNYSKVMYYDASIDQWFSYVPGRASHYNNLDTWDRSMGIWIQMTDDATLTIKGLEPVSTNITLYPGWNMVGYPSATTGNNGLPTEVTKIGYFNSIAEYNLAYDYNPGSYNFEPGKAYWIYNGEDYSVTWTVNY